MSSDFFIKPKGGFLARINVEDKWWTDPRRKKLAKLLGSEALADGCMIQAWRAAQEYRPNKIPTEVWDCIEGSRSILEANLASASGDGILLRGASEHLDWVLERRTAAKIGGKKSAESRKKRYGTSQPIRSKPEANASCSRSKPEASDSVSYSDSKSDSDSGKVSTTCDFIAAYCERFKTRYGVNPKISPKDSGVAKRLAALLNGTSLLYLDAFFSLPDSWLVKKKHPLSAMEANMNEIVVFAKTGAFTSKREAAQVDDAVALSAALARAAT